MDGEEGALLDLADAILDDVVVNWDERSADTPPTDHVLIGEFRAIQAIGRFHRRPAAVPLHLSGSQWGHLKVESIIGRGSFGVVYRAYDTTLDRDVALKVFPVYAADTEALEEGRWLAKVHHPNVVTIHGAGSHSGYAGLWMERLAGETLAQLVAREGALEPARAVSIGRQLCEAVAAVHAAGLLHRDIKAQNVMMTPQGRVVLMDFGAGRIAALAETRRAGTPLYLAPEILSGQVATPSSDLYSVGVLLFYLLTATYPSSGRTLAELTTSVTADRSVEFGRLRSAVPRRLSREVVRVLSAVPAARHGSATEFGRAIDGALRLGRLSRRALLAGGAAAAVVAAATTPPGRRLLRVIAPASLGVGGMGFGDRQEPSARRLTLPNEALWSAGRSHDGRSFAYTTYSGDIAVFDLVTARAETVIKATEGETAELVVASPDGVLLAYQWWTRDRRFQLRVVDRRTGESRIIFENDQLETVVPIEWSRDGSELLAVARFKSGPGAIWLVDLATGARSTVRTFEDEGPSGSSLSADRQYIVYDTPAGGPADRRRLRIVDRHGSNDHQLLGDADADERVPLWTADGRGVFFLSDRTGSPEGWVVDVEAGTARGTPRLALRHLAGVTPLALSNMNSLSYRMETGAYEIFEQALDESGTRPAREPRRIPTRARAAVLGPVYSPDGRSIAYVQRRRTAATLRSVLTIMNLQTGEERELAPPFAFEAGPRWSPDSRLLLVRGRIRPGEHAFLIIEAESGALAHHVVGFAGSEGQEFGPILWSSDPESVLYGQARRGLVRYHLRSEAESVLYENRDLPVTRVQRALYGLVTGVLAISGPTRDGDSIIAVAEDGSFRELVRRKSSELAMLQGWSHDGTALYFTAPNVSVAPPHDLWRVPAAGGPEERLSVQIPGATQLNGLSFHPFDPRFAYTGGYPRSELWLRDNFLE